LISRTFPLFRAANVARISKEPSRQEDWPRDKAWGRWVIGGFKNKMIEKKAERREGGRRRSEKRPASRDLRPFLEQG